MWYRMVGISRVEETGSATVVEKGQLYLHFDSFRNGSLQNSKWKLELKFYRVFPTDFIPSPRTQRIYLSERFCFFVYDRGNVAAVEAAGVFRY